MQLDNINKMIDAAKRMGGRIAAKARMPKLNAAITGESTPLVALRAELLRIERHPDADAFEKALRSNISRQLNLNESATLEEMAEHLEKARHVNKPHKQAIAKALAQASEFEYSPEPIAGKAVAQAAAELEKALKH
ncbi:MAG: hypothetical protein AABW54_02555, partial [Candidatus Micrarchaeota archaeon]